MITKHPASRTLVIHTIGNIDALKAEHYRQQLRALVDDGYHSIIFDLSETEYVNSCGLGLLVEFFTKIKKIGGTYRLINCSRQVLWLLRQSHLEKLLVDEEDASAPADSEAAQPRFDDLHELMHDEIVLLSHFNRVIAQTLRESEPSAIARVVLQGVADALHTRHGLFYLLEADERHLKLGHALEPINQEQAPERFPLKINRLEYEILQHEEIRLLDLSGGGIAQAGLFSRLGFRQMVVASIGTASRRHGFIVVEAGEETEKVMQTARPLIDAFVRVCAQALEKTELLREMTNRNEELSRALNNLSQAHHSLINAGRLAAMGTVISGLGHQLNNKLVPVLGYCQLLANKKNLPDDIHNKIDMIHAASNEMQQVIEKLLRLSRVRERLDTTFDPHERLHTALDLLSGVIEKQSLEVRTHHHADQVTLAGDGDLFLQALVAILHRACMSFAPETGGGWIGIATSETDARFQIMIEDNGAGLEEFDEEDWLDPIVPLSAIGSGQIFNYNIPRGVIRRHHGTMSVENRKGGGKRVTIDLPYATTQGSENDSLIGTQN